MCVNVITADDARKARDQAILREVTRTDPIDQGIAFNAVHRLSSYKVNFLEIPFRLRFEAAEMLSSIYRDRGFVVERWIDSERDDLTISWHG